MTSRVRWGLLSTARINRRLIPAIRASRTSELVAVASRSQESANSYAQEWKIPRAYGSYAELIADPQIDCIYNPLPNDLHLEWTLKALEAGKHVLCEKPLVLLPSDIETIMAASARCQRWAAEAFMYRHHPQTRQALDLVRSGALGQVSFIRGTFTYFLDRPADIRWSPQHGGGGLLDVGCYPVSYALFLAGALPYQVFGWQKLSPSGVDTDFSGHLLFQNGLVAQFNCGLQAVHHSFMEITGTTGRLCIPNPFRPMPEFPMILVDGKKEQKIKTSRQDAYLSEVEDMNQSILENRPPRVSLEESLNLSRILAALRASASQNSPVSIP